MRPRSGSFPQFKTRLKTASSGSNTNFQDDQIHDTGRKEIELTSIGGRNAHWEGSQRLDGNSPVFLLGGDKEEPKVCDNEFPCSHSIEELNSATLKQLEESSSVVTSKNARASIHDKDVEVTTGDVQEPEDVKLDQGKLPDLQLQSNHIRSADAESSPSAISSNADLQTDKHTRSTKSASPDLPHLLSDIPSGESSFSPASEILEAPSGGKSVGTGSTSSTGSYLVVESGTWRASQSPELSPIGTGPSGDSSDEWVMYPNPASMKSIHIKADDLKDMGVLRSSEDEEEEEGVVEIVAGLLDLLGYALVKLPRRDLPMVHGIVLKWERLIIMAHHAAAPVRAAVVRVSTHMPY